MKTLLKYQLNKEYKYKLIDGDIKRAYDVCISLGGKLISVTEPRYCISNNLYCVICEVSMNSVLLLNENVLFSTSYHSIKEL